MRSTLEANPRQCSHSPPRVVGPSSDSLAGDAVVAALVAVLADVVADLEAHPVGAALWVAVGPTVVDPSAELAALAVVLVVHLVVAAPLAALGPKACPGRPRPKGVRWYSSPSADDLEGFQAAVPASASPEWVVLETRTASGMVLWTRAEHARSPILQ